MSQRDSGLGKINGSVARHEKELSEQVRRHGEMLGAHETALQQSRGLWEATVIVAGIASAVGTAVE